MSLPQHKGLPTGAMNPNKLAMSKALGAAFLNHQVEQLEKTVTNGGGNSVGNWRNRGRSPAQPHGAPAMTGKRPPMAPGIKVASRKPEESQAARKAARAQQSREATAGVKHEAVQHVAKRSVDEDKHEKKQGKNGKEKDADIVVVDASVLVHALYQLKKWCRDGREEVIIVPLEALNTLDLLKKGSNNLAQRARAASRLLEAQVGTNPRIRVQQDDAYVPWDKIKFNDDPISASTDSNQLSTSPNSKAGPISNSMSPEWIRRTICCAVWEVQNAATTLAQTSQSSSSASPPKTSPLDNKAVEATANPSQPASVLLAVLRPSDPSDPRGAPGHAPKNSDSSTDGIAHLEPVVPLPAPSLPPQNKFEPRAAGPLVAQWAKKAGMKLIELDPTTPGKGESAGAGGSEDTPARPKHISPRPPPNAHGHGPAHGPAHGMGPGRARRVSAAADVAHAFGHKKGHSGGAETGLVERPPAVRTMMEMVAQPKTVVRVLARGEKLDP